MILIPNQRWWNGSEILRCWILLWEEVFCFLFLLSLSLTHISISFSHSSFLEDCHTPKENWQASALLVKPCAWLMGHPTSLLNKPVVDTIISYSTLLHWTRYTLRILVNTGTHIPKISETYMPSLASFSSFVLRIQNARIRTLVPAHLSHAFQTNPHWKKRRKPLIFFGFLS